MDDQRVIKNAIDQKKPRLVFLAGRTSTGKTTLSKILQKKYDCAVIELDDILDGLDVPAHAVKYVEAYLNRDFPDFIQSFVNAVRQQITQSLTKYPFVIIEGGLANVDTLQEIIMPWSDSFLFIYMQPKDIDVYKQRLLSRFILSSKNHRNRLPLLLWDKFSSEQLETYYRDRIVTPEIDEIIKRYAKESMDVSEARLANFSTTFNDLIEIGI